jgi:hypothetical protein
MFTEPLAKEIFLGVSIPEKKQCWGPLYTLETLNIPNCAKALFLGLPQFIHRIVS